MNRTIKRLFIFLCLFIFFHFNIVAFRKHLAQRRLGTPSEDSELLKGAHPDEARGLGKEPVYIPPPRIIRKPQSKWCQYNECLKGRWLPRRPSFANLGEFQAAFTSRGSSPFSECPIPDPPGGESRLAEEEKGLKTQRLVNMMNHVWKPDRGMQVPWDPEDFLVRLLKTPGGIVFLGDSVTAGWQHAFNSYLEQGISAEKGGIMFLEIPSYIDGKVTAGIRAFLMAPGHPKTKELQARAGVPDSRMNFPVFTSIEEHLLLQEQDMRKITVANGAQEGFVWTLGALKHVPGWESFLHNLTTPRSGEEETVTNDSIVVMNTGPHWSRGTLHMLPELGSTVAEQRALREAYKAMMDIVIGNMNQMRRMKILYRATSAAHPLCSTKTEPYADYLTALQGEADFVDQVTEMAANLNDRKVRLRWDWDRFDVHNDLWRQAIPRLQRDRAALLLKGVDLNDVPPKWLFVDFWPMTLQRPDAHSDCLHWCLPAIYNEWSRHILHILHLEAGL